MKDEGLRVLLVMMTMMKMKMVVVMVLMMRRIGMSTLTMLCSPPVDYEVSHT